MALVDEWYRRSPALRRVVAMRLPLAATVFVIWGLWLLGALPAVPAVAACGLIAASILLGSDSGSEVSAISGLSLPAAPSEHLVFLHSVLAGLSQPVHTLDAQRD